MSVARVLVAAIAVAVAVLCCSSSSTTEAARIGMYGFPKGPSHHMVMTKIGRELVSRGHEVHVQ